MRGVVSQEAFSRQYQAGWEDGYRDGYAGRQAVGDYEPNLGLATTGQLLDELRARFEIVGADHGGLHYRTVDR